MQHSLRLIVLSPLNRLNKIGKNPNLVAHREEDLGSESKTINAVVNALAEQAAHASASEESVNISFYFLFFSFFFSLYQSLWNERSRVKRKKKKKKKKEINSSFRIPKTGTQHGAENTSSLPVAQTKVWEQFRESGALARGAADLPQERHFPQGLVSMTTLVILAYREILTAPWATVALHTVDRIELADEFMLGSWTLH